MMRKLPENYDIKDIEEAVEFCAGKELFCATEVLVFLTSKHGVKKAEKIMPVRTKKYYRIKAESLSKYDFLSEV